MFCYQWEQTAGCSGCVGKAGVCGKSADVANLQDRLTGALIGLARAADTNTPTASTHRAAYLVKNFKIHPTTTPEQDLKEILS